MSEFFKKLRGLDEKKRKVAVWVMSSIAMFLVILVWAGYMRTVMRPTDDMKQDSANVVSSLAKAAASIPRVAGLWIAGSAHYLLGQREIVIEK